MFQLSPGDIAIVKKMYKCDGNDPREVASKKKMLESRSEDALVLLVKLVKSTVETVETVETFEIVETVEMVETVETVQLYRLKT